MSDSKPLSPCQRCRRDIDEQTVCGAINCPCFPAEGVIPAFHRCDNCCAEYGEGMDFGPEIPHFWERVSPGETMPSGECPACGSLCHPVSADEELFGAAPKMLAALEEAASWNRSDIRGIDDITPNLRMLRARGRVLRKAITAAKGKR